MIQLAWPFVALVAIAVSAFLFDRWAGNAKRITALRDEVSAAMFETGNQIGTLKDRAQKLEDDVLNLSQRVAPTRLAR